MLCGLYGRQAITTVLQSFVIYEVWNWCVIFILNRNCWHRIEYRYITGVGNADANFCTLRQIIFTLVQNIFTQIFLHIRCARPVTLFKFFVLIIFTDVFLLRWRINLRQILLTQRTHILQSNLRNSYLILIFIFQINIYSQLRLSIFFLRIISWIVIWFLQAFQRQVWTISVKIVEYAYILFIIPCHTREHHVRQVEL